MRIDSIELYLVQNRFFRPWRTAYGEDASNCVLITRLISGRHEGWSESSPLPGPNYSYEYGEGVYNVADRFLSRVIIGREFNSAKELNAAMSVVKGNPFAKAGIEIAWWTLQADILGVSLSQLIGGTPGEVEIGGGCGIYDTYDELLAAIDRELSQGFRRIKLKVAHGWDIDMLRVVRRTYPNTVFHIDCNASYTFEESDIFKQMDDLYLAMIEQPFASGDIYDHAKLQKMLDTPLCLDESITEPWHARQAAELGACKYINIKPARVGGLQNTIDINNICKNAGIGCWIGGMLESDIGKAICLEAASLSNMVYPHDITPSIESYPDTFTETLLTYSSPCHFHTSERIGTPIKPKIEKLKKIALKSVILEAEKDNC